MLSKMNVMTTQVIIYEFLVIIIMACWSTTLVIYETKYITSKTSSKNL